MADIQRSGEGDRGDGGTRGRRNRSRGAVPSQRQPAAGARAEGARAEGAPAGGAPAGGAPAAGEAALAGKSADLLRAIRRIIRAVDVQSKRVTRAAGLTIPQIVILQTLRERGAISTRGLAAEISLSAPTVTTVLDRLEGRGLVRRTRKLEDRRVVLTELTPQGRAVLSRAPPLMHDGFLAAYAGMAPQAQDNLVAALETLADLMDAAPLPPGLLIEDPDRSG